jgi:hypothetical protein
MKTIAILMLMAAAAVASEVPAEAAKLVEIREREINKINVAYLQKLDALLVDYRAKGNTEAVKVVETLIAEVEGDAPAPKEKSSDLDSALKGTWRRDSDGAVWIFNDAKTGTFKGTDAFKVIQSSNGREFSVTSAKWSDTLSYNRNTDTIRGVDANGRKYRLTRIE